MLSHCLVCLTFAFVVLFIPNLVSMRIESTPQPFWIDLSDQFISTTSGSRTNISFRCVFKTIKSQWQLLELNGMKTHDFEDNSSSFQSLWNDLPSKITKVTLGLQRKNSVILLVRTCKNELITSSCNHPVLKCLSDFLTLASWDVVWAFSSDSKSR